ncbi:HET-domain-containing protein [Dichomitus squalens]|nr:HET-domain-containing protein [Dichomitus squalens]
MRLLNTNTARLKEFANHEEIPSYAILSHVWQQQEQTLQEVRSLDPQDCPRDHVSPKIRQCCIFAEAEGFEWIWIDTCCIDKTSSAELSEAINSMYAWYAIADVCYVWLHDVDDTHPSRHRSFSKSIWFQRGWTLQELIAPAYVVFLSRDWHTLGTKQTLAHRIEEITGIDCDVLLRRVELSQISVARRMSWAAFRKTTRLEDRAYSLLGIFDVHIPTIYGEGSNAFLRLQLEILKQCPDQSLFAWGPPAIDYDALIANGTSPTFVGPELEDPSLGSLLAVSPSNFANSSDITPMSLDVLGERIDLEGMRPPDYTYTSYGIRATFPLVNVPISRNPIILLAVLACQDSHDNLIALLLHQRLRDASAYYRYHVGVDLKARTVSDNNHNPPFSRCYRTCTIPLQSLALLLKEDRQRQIQIGDVYIDNPKATFPRPLRNLPSVASIGRGIAATSFFNVLGKVEITLKRWEGCRRSQATFVYLVELKLAPAGSEAAERPLSFMNYTEAPTTGGGFILYDANAPDAEPLPIKNALQLEGSDMASVAADGIKIFVSTQTDSTEDERDTGSHLSPLLTLSPLSAGPERGHTRRHSSPNPEPFSYAGGPYNNASLPRQVSPSRSLHSPELPSPYLSPHSPSTASFDPAFLSPHQSPRPPTRPLPSDTSVSPGHSPRGWDGRELPSETYDALRTPRLPYSALPSPSVLTDELPEHSLSAPVSPFLGLQRYAASATHTQRGRSPSHERGHVSRWS